MGDAGPSGAGALIVHRSNRTEALVGALATSVARPPRDPFDAEWIVVQGRGMERWLSLELASRLSVFAHPRFPFPRALLEHAFEQVLGQPEDCGIDYQPERLMWSIAQRLPELIGEPDFAPIRGYLDGDEDGRRLLQLSERIANSLDHYVIYRPEMMLAWEAGQDAAPGRPADPESRWQARLWRELVALHGPDHLAGRMGALHEALSDGRADVSNMPERIALFGISTLPPLYVSGLVALSRHIEVNLFILSPSREFWGEIRSARESLRKLRGAGADADAVEEALHLEEGNPLLASLGRVGRDFQQILEGAADYVESDRDLYRDPLPDPSGSARVLHTLQSDILALQTRGADGAGPEPAVLAADDDSLSVHSCHGPMREAEVLRDQLLDLFERHPELEPRDVIVMTPDMERYAPYVEAVFGGSGQTAATIPFRIADRSARASYEVVDAFLRLLAVLSGRLRASEVLDLLCTPCIRERFGIGADDEPVLHDWVMAAGIRWGEDAAHRVSESQPETDANTWRQGLDRLLLGHAFASDPPRLFAGVLPCDGVASGGAELLGQLVEFCEALFSLRRRLGGAHALESWPPLLAELQERMLVRTGDTHHQHQQIREAVESTFVAAGRAGYRGRPDLASIRELLSERLAGAPPPGGFLSGGVSFCEMVPMRTIPFRVVCLMGMNDEAFPRIRTPLGFDLIARRPMPGDRTSRDDDRYLFLEALLSARDHVIVTYEGQDVRVGDTRPPSVVVGELLDAVGQSFRPPGDARAECEVHAKDPQRWVRARLVLQHPIQAFSRRYFSHPASADGEYDDPRFFSYSAHHAEAARALAGEPATPAPFVRAPLSGEPAEDQPLLLLDELVAFFRDPVKRFLQTRLGILLGEDRPLPADREPMQIEGLERYAAGRDLLESGAGASLASVAEAIRAGGMLPLGVPGEVALDELLAEAEGLRARAVALRGGERLADLEIDLEVDGRRLVGTLTDLWPGGLVRAQFSKLGQRSELDVWIRHLVLGMVAPKDWSGVSHLVGRPADKAGKRCVHFDAPADPGGLLAHLIDVYEHGQRVALPFFHDASRRYAKAIVGPKGEDEARAIKDAYYGYRGQEGQRPGECADPYVRQAFAGVDPLAPGFDVGSEALQFRRLARRVFEPMLRHRGEGA
jgi:exodeoxyribonuclease V gamma subunit